MRESERKTERQRERVRERERQRESQIEIERVESERVRADQSPAQAHEYTRPHSPQARPQIPGPRQSKVSHLKVVCRHLHTSAGHPTPSH